MKKILMLLLMVVVCISFCACGDSTLEDSWAAIFQEDTETEETEDAGEPFVVENVENTVIDDSYDNIAALRTDGTIVMAGTARDGCRAYADLRNVVSLNVGINHLVALYHDGTAEAVALGIPSISDEDCFAEVDAWTEIVDVAIAGSTIVGLQKDGTIILAGDDDSFGSHVEKWSRITAIEANADCIVGLQADGTVKAYSKDGSLDDASEWTDIRKIVIGQSNTLYGIRSDGTVAAVGENEHGLCDAESWTDIVDAAIGYSHAIGLKADGTVVTVGENEYEVFDVADWNGIVAVAAGSGSSVGVKENGTVVAIGNNAFNGVDVSAWSNIGSGDWDIQSSDDVEEEITEPLM